MTAVRAPRPFRPNIQSVKWTLSALFTGSQGMIAVRRPADIYHQAYQQALSGPLPAPSIGCQRGCRLVLFPRIAPLCSPDLRSSRTSRRAARPDSLGVMLAIFWFWPWSTIWPSRGSFPHTAGLQPAGATGLVPTIPQKSSLQRDAFCRMAMVWFDVDQSI